MCGRTGLANGASRGSTRARRRAARLSLLVAAFCALLSAGTAQAATVTVGSPLTASFSPNQVGTTATTINSALPEAGANVTSPVTGTVVRWRITQSTGGPFKLRVLTPAGGNTFTGAGTSAPASPASQSTQVFSTDLPIRAGQTIGIDNTDSADRIGSAGVTSAAEQSWSPPLADGSTRVNDADTPDSEAGFNADVQPLPTISSLNPSSGPSAGGTVVTINGQNFEGTTAVNFGSTPAKSFTVMSDNVITAVTPPSSTGTVDVTVKNPGQSPTTAADRFAFARKCVVPNLKGKKLKAARKALKKAHCKLGKVKGPKGKKAKVKKQKPKPGTVLDAGSKVRVTTKKH